MTEDRSDLTQEELERQDARDLPDREEMSVIRGIGPEPMPISPISPLPIENDPSR